jgi:hypothetical protein
VAEAASDTNGNGLYDTIALSVTAQITTSGYYMLRGDLAAPTGEMVSSGSTGWGDDAEPLCSGPHTFALNFNGKTVRGSRLDGPYKIPILFLEFDSPDRSWPPAVAYAEDLYTTAAYHASEFEGDGLAPVVTESRAEDTTGNGLYDYLAIDVALSVPGPGEYQWRGMLAGAGDCLVTDAAGEGPLDVKTPAAFVVTGNRIRTRGCDGPYTLTDVYIVSTDRSEPGGYFDSLYTTPPYAAADFDPAPTVSDHQESKLRDTEDDDIAP